MARMRIRHLVERLNSNGAARFYWQPAAELRAQGWRGERLPDAREAAMARAEALNADVDAWRRGEVAPNAPAAVKARAKRPPAGTVAALRLDYEASRFWSGLAPATRRSYAWCLDAIEAWAGDQMARNITAPAVQAFYEAQLRRVEGSGRRRQVIETPAKAAAVMRVLRLLLQVGERLGYLPTGSNPAKRPGVSYTRKRDPRPWTDAEVAHMAAAADALGWRSIGSAIILNSWLGQREGDVLRLAPWQFEAHSLVFRQGKTGRQVALPLHLVPHLVERLRAERDRPGVVLSTEWLLPHEGTRAQWNQHTFRHVFAEVRATAAAGDTRLDLVPMQSCTGLLFMELRHTAVTRLHEAGADDLAIAGITGHTPATVRSMCDKHYLVRSEKAAGRAFRARMQAEGEGGG